MKTFFYLFSLTFIFFGCSDSKEKNLKTVELKKNTDKVVKSPNSKYDFVVENSCGFDRSMINEKVYSFNSDLDADNALNDIMKLTGLPANFEIRAASVDNACAVIKCDDKGNCDRFILYNQEFMEKVKDQTSTHFSELAILAHEIAHHLSGHTLSNQGSSYDMELEADKFAGFILYKLGANIEESKRAYSSLGERGSLTHPPKKARVAALTNGWYDAKRNGEKVVVINSENKKTNTATLKSNNNSTNTKTQQSKNDRWFIYHRMCTKNGKFYVSEGEETSFCTGCHSEYYMRWTGGTDILTGKPSVFDYKETERSNVEKLRPNTFDDL